MRPSLLPTDVAALTKELDGLGDPADPAAWMRLLRTLYGVGRQDLPLGRLFEGHVDALQIICRYGTPEQRNAAESSARDGAVFGVWNADLPDDPTRLGDSGLSGGKAFASGAGLVTHALISAEATDGRRLLLLDLATSPPTIDRSWWRVSGMQRSETHIARWRDAPVDAEMLIGAPGDYVREPWFSGGALRFAAVQAGGIAAIVDQVRDQLVAQGRAADPHQAGRLADLFLAAQAAADAVRVAGSVWRPEDPATTLAQVAAARAAVYHAGEKALTLAQAAVGVSAMFVDHPLAATLADLNVYLRQPAPDAQRVAAGAGVAAGLLTVAL
jgi:hypothetical protein